MDDKIQENQGRINMYAFISRLLIEEVDENLLEKIKNNPDLLELFPNTKEWESFKTKSTKELIDEDLNVDYTTVFILNAYPYESVFMNDEGHINPTPTNPTLQFYLEHGYEIDLNKTRVLSPDHIAVELEFMITLIQEQLKAYSMNDQEGEKKALNLQKEFMENHILQWAPIYLMAARDMSETPFYYDVCQMALDFIMTDYEYILEQLEAENVSK
ncbi:molecular chaperone TorD family protein [Sulfurihydrogenibium sp.]|jgi:TorA maturation chaperone TorD|uniref:TorD/DmsD family molecular chaperone n=1 Tax=Sulfurihydrogenibium sp. TaxID=2053621 RepID=UPI00262CCEDA|nr:molecular chaperone TorD family protein [Sulfurihydrogenibium sp.]